MYSTNPVSTNSRFSILYICYVGSIPGLGRSSGGGNGNPLQHSESHQQRSLVGYSPWGHKESDMTEHEHTCTYHYNGHHSGYQCRLSGYCPS